MRELVVRSERGPYRVVVGEDLLGDAGLLEAAGVAGPLLPVSNVTVGPLHGRRFAAALGAGPLLELPDGERYKTWAQVERVCREAVRRHLGREGVLVAVGGGVVTDMVGFAASVVLRGIRWVAVPTTLLAMVDAAVGGKTGIDLPEGKNLVGSFWPPRLVVADVATLATLPEREMRAGLAEVVKAAWIGDRGLLELVPEAGDLDRRDGARWEELVARAVAVKARIVEEDEREAGARQALNLGHTMGHALEAATGYERLLHGEAVAWGLLVAGRLALAEGVLSGAGWERLREAVRRVEPLPAVEDLELERLLPFLGRDKKRDGRGVAWVLPADEGVRLGCRPTLDRLRAAWDEVRRRAV